MARPLRIEYPGAVYHVTSRGNARQAIFVDEADRSGFLDAFGDAVVRFGWLCHAYCLMDNHYHLLIETPVANLARGMRQVNGVYTQRFNRRHGRAGHLFQGRYSAILVERDSYLLELSRYVVLNPVRAGMIDRPDAYAWSSCGATLGLTPAPDFLTTDWLLGQFGKRRGTARERYRRFVDDGVDAPSPWEGLKGQMLLGSEAFVDGLAPLLDGTAAVADVPKRQRRLTRPSLVKVLAGAEGASKGKRNRLIAVAHLEHGYTLAEIGRHLGLHYTTISKVVRAERMAEN